MDDFFAKFLEEAIFGTRNDSIEFAGDLTIRILVFLFRFLFYNFYGIARCPWRMRI